ncbi:MAG: hypothetical protein R3A13_11130, partial [Bdellovibrionota bacterium]
FKSGESLGFLELSDEASILEIGGTNSQFKLSAEALALPSLVIENNNSIFYAFQRVFDISVQIGRSLLDDKAELFHNDNLIIEDYRLVILCPSKQRQGKQPVFTEVRSKDPSAGTILKSWDSGNDEEDTKLLADKSRPSGGIFGRIADLDDDSQEFAENIDIDTVQTTAYHKFEQRLVMLVLVILVAAIFTLALWWAVVS